MIGERLRVLREQKGLSQGDIQKRSGLPRTYLSRVENGHTVPAVGTLEKWAKALEIPMYQLFYDGEEPPERPALPKWEKADTEDARYLSQLRRLLNRMDTDHRRLLLQIVQKMALPSRRSHRSFAKGAK